MFSRQASETNRELQDREFNAKLDLQLDGFFKLLSGYFASASAAKCLEFLIRRMKIHVFNVEQVVTCALPYHATPEFVKLVQLANLTNTSFYWLKGVKDTGAAPPRNALVARCRHDAAFLSFVCEAAAAAASNKVRVFGPCGLLPLHVFFVNYPYTRYHFSSSCPLPCVWVFTLRALPPFTRSPRYPYGGWCKLNPLIKKSTAFSSVWRGCIRALKCNASLRLAARVENQTPGKACRHPIPRSQRTAQIAMDGGA